MKILSIGLDKKIFEKDSWSRKRQIEYGKYFDETHIIVFTKRGYLAEKISDNVWVYPTNSLTKLFYIFDAYKIGKKIIKNFKSKNENWLITTQDPFETGLVGYLLKRKFKIPLILQLHTEIPFRYFALESFLNFFRWFLAKFLVKKADRIRVVSESIKLYLEEKFKCQENKIFVLPIRVDLEKIKNREVKVNVKEKFPNYKFYFLTACRLVEVKNIPLQIKTISELVKKYPDIILIIVGDGPERKKLEKLVKKLNLLKNVKFEGWQEDVVSYMKTSDCFLFSSNYEGYGLAVIEALFCGLPVIATKVGVAKEVIKNGENGYLVEVGDKEAFFKACKKIIENPIKREKVLMNLPVVLEKEDYLNQYRQILNL
ncbi:MAG: glycosyltransferase family 4 protein [candidate division WOR-3 bacterium]